MSRSDWPIRRLKFRRILRLEFEVCNRGSDGASALDLVERLVREREAEGMRSVSQDGV